MLRLFAFLIAPLICGAAHAARIELAGPTTFYVSATGNDANDGLTAATPKLTTNAMLVTLQKDYDFKCNEVVISHANGSYAPISVAGAFVGTCGKYPRIACQNGTTRGNCSINASGDAVYATGTDTTVLIEGFTLTAAETALHATLGASIYYRDLEFGAATFQIAAEKRGTTFYVAVRADGSKANYFISGNAQAHLYVNGGGTAYLTETINSNGIQFIGSVTFAVAFADVIQQGCLTAHTNAWTGTINNYPALYVRWNSVGGIASQLPGNQSLNNVDASSSLM